MELNILIFGQLIDITGSARINLPAVKDTNDLKQEMNRRFPLFINAKYVMAVDNHIVNENTSLNPGCTIALLPPFSGG